MTTKKSKRVSFTFDERSRVPKMTIEEVLESMKHVVSEYEGQPPPANTSAAKSHLRAALYALGEHDCASTRRHIEEALNLL